MFSGHPYPCIFITSHPCSPIFIHFHPFSLKASKSLLGSNFWQPMQALHFVVDFEADTSYILSYILCQFVFMRRSFSGGTKGRLLNSTQRWRMLLIVGALLASISGRSWWSRQPRICNWKLQRPTSCRFLTIQCTQRISKICFDFLFVKLLLYIDVYCCYVHCRMVFQIQGSTDVSPVSFDFLLSSCWKKTAGSRSGADKSFCNQHFEQQHFVSDCVYSQPRPGNVILFQPPVKATTGCGIDIGMIISVWKGVKQPKLHASGTPVESVSAFRVLVLGMQDPDQVPARDWKCNDRSMAYVCRLESLVFILDCESSALAFVFQPFCCHMISTTCLLEWSVFIFVFI